MNIPIVENIRKICKFILYLLALELHLLKKIKHYKYTLGSLGFPQSHYPCFLPQINHIFEFRAFALLLHICLLIIIAKNLFWRFLNLKWYIMQPDVFGSILLSTTKSSRQIQLWFQTDIYPDQGHVGYILKLLVLCSLGWRKTRGRRTKQAGQGLLFSFLLKIGGVGDGCDQERQRAEMGVTSHFWKASGVKCSL